MKRLVSFLFFALIAFCAFSAFGADPGATPTVTGVPLLDKILAIVGSAYIVLSTLLPLLPSSWRLTQILAIVVADLKKVNTLTPDERAARTAAKVGVGLWFLFAIANMSACTPGEVKAANEAVDLANAACELSDQQADPAWVQFVCKNLDQNGKPIQFTARAPKGRPLGKLEVCPAK